MLKLKRNNPLLIFTIVFGLLIFLYAFGLLRPLEKVLLRFIQPVSSRFYFLGNRFENSYTEQREKEELIQKISDLEKELAQIVIEDVRYQEIAEENRKLRAQLKFISENNFTVVLANIVAKESDVPSLENERDIVLNKGTKDGLRVGLGVLSEEGAIIGKIVEVKENSALACLSTSPGCQLPASLQNEQRTQGITNGQLGLTIVMNYIPQLEKVTVGDAVVTSGLSEDIPRGLVIGRVTSVKSISNEVWQTATIEPLLNFKNLTVVSVVIP